MGVGARRYSRLEPRMLGVGQVGRVDRRVRRPRVVVGRPRVEEEVREGPRRVFWVEVIIGGGGSDWGSDTIWHVVF